MTIIVRRPAPPLAGLVTGIVYQAGEQPRTLVQKILPDAEPSLWVNLNRDEFRSLGGPGPPAGCRARCWPGRAAALW